MSSEEVPKEIKDVIVEQLSIDVERIQFKSSFMDDLGADSLDIVELIMSMEEKFDVEIPDDEAEKLKTVQDAVDYLKSKGKL